MSGPSPKKEEGKKVRLEWMYDPGAEKDEIDLMNEAVDLDKLCIPSTRSTSLFSSDMFSSDFTSDDNFRKIHEDPLFSIKKEQLRRKQLSAKTATLLRTKLSEKSQLQVKKKFDQQRRSK